MNFKLMLSTYIAMCEESELKNIRLIFLGSLSSFNLKKLLFHFS